MLGIGAVISTLINQIANSVYDSIVIFTHRENEDHDDKMREAEEKGNVSEFNKIVKERSTTRLKRTARAKKLLAYKLLFGFLFYLLMWAFIFYMTVDKSEVGDEFVNNHSFSMLDSIYFVVVVIMTVGFGDYHFIGQSDGYKLMFIFQSLTGFMLLNWMVNEHLLVTHKAEVKYDFIVRVPEEEIHPREDLKKARRELKKHFARVVVLFTVGSVYFSRVEDMSFVDALYFTWVTSSTIGFGDVSVKKDGSKVFMIFFIIFSCSEVATVLKLLGHYHYNAFTYKHMAHLLKLKHNGSRMRMFDIHNDGFVTGGEFLTGYLVSLQKIRQITAAEILAKFRRLSNGKLYIDMSMFRARTGAIEKGVEAGDIAAAQSFARGESVEEQCAAAADASAEVVQKMNEEMPFTIEQYAPFLQELQEESILQEFKDTELNKKKFTEKLNVEDVIDMDARMLDALREKTKRDLDILEHVVNFKVRVFHAAAEAASRTAQINGLEIDTSAKFAFKAAKEYGAWDKAAQRAQDRSRSEEGKLTEEDEEYLQKLRSATSTGSSVTPKAFKDAHELEISGPVAMAILSDQKPGKYAMQVPENVPESPA